MAQEFGVSVGTLRRALGDLTAGGMLVRRRKTGTVVTGRTPDHSLHFVYNYFRLHSRGGALQTSVVRMLGHSLRPATPAEMTRLELKEAGDVHEIHRLRVVEGRPVMHERIIIPAHLVPNFPSNPADIPDRIYFMLWNEYGLKISAIREQVEASLADEVDREVLELPDPSAILVLNEIAYDEMARPLLLNRHRAFTRDDVYINEIH